MRVCVLIRLNVASSMQFEWEFAVTIQFELIGSVLRGPVPSSPVRQAIRIAGKKRTLASASPIHDVIKHAEDIVMPGIGSILDAVILSILSRIATRTELSYVRTREHHDDERRSYH